MPNTDAYLALGMAVVFAIVGGYSLSLVIRFRQSVKLIHTLEMLKEEG